MPKNPSVVIDDPTVDRLDNIRGQVKKRSGRFLSRSELIRYFVMCILGGNEDEAIINKLIERRNGNGMS